VPAVAANTEVSLLRALWALKAPGVASELRED